MLIKALAVEPMQEPYEMFIDDESIRRWLGGYMEVLLLSDTCLLICDEEGKLKGLRRNRRVGDDIIVGKFLLCGESGEEFASISEEDLKKYSKEFALKSIPSWYVRYDWYQCKEGTEYVFMPYKFAEKKGFNMSDYHKVFSGVFDTSGLKDNTAICECLFSKHNLSVLPGKARSMSVSDVIVLHTADGDKRYYTDSFGFQEF